MDSWFKVRITVANEAVEPLSNGLFELSPYGVQIENPEEASSKSVLTIYQSSNTSLEDIHTSIDELIKRIGTAGFDVTGAGIDITSVSDENWAENYKQYFKPVRIGSIIIKPSWEDIEISPGDLLIELDPGLAFGTGSHPTTEGCIYSLQHVIDGGESVLDIGTGSGVLAIAAVRLGATHVEAIDNDSVAIDVARENALANGVEKRIKFHVADIFKHGNLSADITVANLTAPAIVSLLPVIIDNMDGLKKLIVSGITDEQKKSVIGALTKHGFSIEKVFEKNKWVTLVTGYG